MRTWLKDARKKLGLSAEAVARALDVSLSSVSKWEAGLSLPGKPTQRELARVLEDESIPSRFASEKAALYRRKAEQAELVGRGAQ